MTGPNQKERKKKKVHQPSPLHCVYSWLFIDATREEEDNDAAATAAVDMMARTTTKE